MPPVLPYVNVAQEQYGTAYRYARLFFVREQRYNGFADAMCRLWDDYQLTIEMARQVGPLLNRQRLAVRACAMWSLYTKNCVESTAFDWSSGIPF